MYTSLPVRLNPSRAYTCVCVCVYVCVCVCVYVYVCVCVYVCMYIYMLYIACRSLTPF
jgi:hypothetical protein